MNLVFKRLGAKSLFTMILLFGLIIFTGQRASAQYVSVDQVKEILYSYTEQLPAMPLVSKSTYNRSDKLIALGLKKNFAIMMLLRVEFLRVKPAYWIMLRQSMSQCWKRSSFSDKERKFNY